MEEAIYSREAKAKALLPWTTETWMLHGASVAQSQNPCLLRSELEALQTQRALIARVVPDSRE